MGLGSRKPVYGDGQTTLRIRAVCLAPTCFPVAPTCFAVGKISRKLLYITIQARFCSLASGFWYELVKFSEDSAFFLSRPSFDAMCDFRILLSYRGELEYRNKHITGLAIVSRIGITRTLNK